MLVFGDLFFAPFDASIFEPICLPEPVCQQHPKRSVAPVALQMREVVFNHVSPRVQFSFIYERIHPVALFL